MENFQRARQLLLGAVDSVLDIAKNGNGRLGEGSGSSSSFSRNVPDQRTTQETSTGSSIYELSRSQLQQDSVREHKRLFGFQPSKSCSKKGKGRSKVSQKPRPAMKSTWRRDCICLCDTEQTWKPSPEEKMKLAKMGLGLKEVVFECDGSADHVHKKLLEIYPVLRDFGGYTLLRLGSGSKALVEIEGPESGITVPYLKDILNQAKLYIRPLQSDISEEDVDNYITLKVSVFWFYICVE